MSDRDTYSLLRGAVLDILGTASWNTDLSPAKALFFEALDCSDSRLVEIADEIGIKSPFD